MSRTSTTEVVEFRCAKNGIDEEGWKVLKNSFDLLVQGRHQDIRSIELTITLDINHSKPTAKRAKSDGQHLKSSELISAHLKKSQPQKGFVDDKPTGKGMGTNPGA